MNVPAHFCSRCGLTKPIADFYLKRNGNPWAICRACRLVRQRQVYLNRAEYYKQYAKIYHQHNRKQKLQTLSDWQKRNREKCRAHWHRWKAERNGLLIRPAHCELCGAMVSLHAHHTDYSRPLDVEWFCSRCHGEWHRTQREMARD